MAKVAAVFFLLLIMVVTISWGQTKPKADWDYKKTNWTDLLVDSLEKHGKEMLTMENPKDFKKYCKGLTKENRKEFFVMLISSMARYESSHNPKVTYKEIFKDQKGKYVISRGLLQLSKESANGSRYQCGIKDENELHDPKVNLECTVKIMNHWVSTDKVIGTDKKGGARYWSVLRETSNSNAKIINRLKQLPFCK